VADDLFCLKHWALAFDYESGDQMVKPSDRKRVARWFRRWEARRG
jgi:hypothetical protein